MPRLTFCFISTCMVSTKACSLMGSTIPHVPRMEMPPTIPRWGLKVCFARSLPSGAKMTIRMFRFGKTLPFSSALSQTCSTHSRNHPAGNRIDGRIAHRISPDLPSSHSRCPLSAFQQQYPSISQRNSITVFGFRLLGQPGPCADEHAIGHIGIIPANSTNGGAGRLLSSRQITWESSKSSGNFLRRDQTDLMNFFLERAASIRRLWQLPPHSFLWYIPISIFFCSR